MSYVVLARKYRPQSFADLVGQGHVSTTIGNAIARGRVAHAFLFTGVRGVGKTTSARILAKALNCAKGPTAEPCQVCPQCVEITAGSDVDVQEIDGASYNGVDEVRRLQESLPYRPARDRFKIFIVDEVHMLSNAAWNAFLKTLEEPPPHVKFIFATTEVHKVPVTILSRCQRYDFKLLTAQTIAGRLRYVLEQEGVPADDAAVSALAREAAGSMRDAMSLLDQVIAALGSERGAAGAGGDGDGAPGEDRLTAELVARVLGVADRVVLHRMAGALVDGDAAEALRVVGELAQEGYDLPHVARDFLAHLRDLVVAKVCDDPAGLLDLADEEIADVKVLATRASADDLARLHQGFSRSFDDIVRGGQPRASLEMALVRLARRPPLLPVDELLRRLGDLERRLAGAGASGGSAAGPSQGGGGGGGGGPFRGAPPPQAGAPRRPPAQAGSVGVGEVGVASGAAVRPEASPREPGAAGAGRGAAPVNAEGPPEPPVAQEAATSFDVPSGAAAGVQATHVSAAPVSAPVFAPAAVPAPASVSASAPASVSAAVPASASAPVSAPAPAPMPVSAPTFVPAPAPAFAPPDFAAPSLPNGAPTRGLPVEASPLGFAGITSPSSRPPARPQPPPAPPNSPPFSQPSRPQATPARPQGGGPAGSFGPGPGAPVQASSGAAPGGDGFAAWRAIIDILRGTNARIASFFDHAVPLHVDAQRIVIGFDEAYVFADHATDAASQSLLLAAARRHFGRAPEISFERAATRSGTIAQTESAEKKARIEAARLRVIEHPLVTAAIELLGAEVKDVRLGQDLAES